MQMGTAGYKELMDERRENYKLLKDEMCKVAEKYGERVLETKNNPISIGNFRFKVRKNERFTVVTEKIIREINSLGVLVNDAKDSKL